MECDGGTSRAFVVSIIIRLKLRCYAKETGKRSEELCNILERREKSESYAVNLPQNDNVNMHELFASVLAKRDLSRAGELFSIEDSKIVDDLTDVVIKISHSSYVTFRDTFR